MLSPYMSASSSSASASAPLHAPLQHSIAPDQSSLTIDGLLDFVGLCQEIPISTLRDR